MENTLEFEKYLAENKNPFRILKTPAKDTLVSILEREEENCLFPTHDLDNALREMEELYDRGKLYLRWTQQVGDKRRPFAVPNGRFAYFTAKLVPFIKRQPIHPSAHGGEKGWSANKSLQTHLPVASAFSFDLADAFNNQGITQVFDFFYNAFEKLGDTERRECAGFLSNVCTVTTNEQRSLPQGSLHGIALFNRILHGIDQKLSSQSATRGLTYTRWVDDMTISSSLPLDAEEFMGAVELTSQYAPVSQTKVFYQRGEPIYLLGQVIERGRVFKNSKVEREAKKTKPLNYHEWFNGPRRYDKWT